MFTTMRMMLAGALVSLAGFSASATAAPPAMGNPGFRPFTPGAINTALRPIGGDPRTWSPNPIRPIPPIGSDPRTWSPNPIRPIPPIGSDPRTWSPNPLNPYPMPYPYYPVYTPYYPMYNPYPYPSWSPSYTPYTPLPNPYLPGSTGLGKTSFQ